MTTLFHKLEPTHYGSILKTDQWSNYPLAPEERQSGSCTLLGAKKKKWLSCFSSHSSRSVIIVITSGFEYACFEYACACFFALSCLLEVQSNGHTIPDKEIQCCSHSRIGNICYSVTHTTAKTALTNLFHLQWWTGIRGYGCKQVFLVAPFY